MDSLGKDGRQRGSPADCDAVRDRIIWSCRPLQSVFRELTEWCSEVPGRSRCGAGSASIRKRDHGYPRTNRSRRARLPRRVVPRVDRRSGERHLARGGRLAKQRAASVYIWPSRFPPCLISGSYVDPTNNGTYGHTTPGYSSPATLKRKVQPLSACLGGHSLRPPVAVCLDFFDLRF